MKSEARPDNQQLVEEDRARSCPRKRSAFVAALRSSRASFDTLKRRAIANTNTSKLMDDTAHHREGAGLNSEKTTDFASDNTTGTSDEKQSIAIFSAAASPLSASWRKEPLSSTETSKVIQILQACKDHDRDALVALATTENGFVEDEVRRITCGYHLRLCIGFKHSQFASGTCSADRSHSRAHPLGQRFREA